ncbi:MAG: DUF4405 domain-containing protein [Candidatus Hydrogenedentes bacterium]|nr:DUF4405 domain-containing protein [Candidatus Hydrogenedentota bacterium]
MSEAHEISKKDTKPAKKCFNLRGFFSLLLFGAFSLLAFSGIVLYITPKGRVAHWTGWLFLGLGKEEWSTVHITLSLLVLIAVGFHLYYNWSIFWNYIVRKSRGTLNLKREMALAILLCAATFFGTLYGVPPFSTIIQWNDDIKMYWELRAPEPPMPHAEELTIEELAQEVDKSLEEVVALLEAAGIQVKDTSIKINDLAVTHGVVPSKIFAIIQPESVVKIDGGTGTKHRGMGQENTGRGYGRMTVQQCCEKAALSVEEGVAQLKKAGIEASGHESIKAIAQRSGITPGNVAKIILGE